MRGWRITVPLVLAGGFGACSTGSRGSFIGDGGGDGNDGGDSSTLDSSGMKDVIRIESGSGDTTCANVSYTAQAAPAALLFVLDGSGSMAADNKWANAQQAIVTAMDLPVFDTMSIGLLIYPNVKPVPAMCPALMEFGLNVTCAVSGLPQVPLAVAGPDMSNTTGVRGDIYNELVTANPATNGVGEGNPAYDALNNGIATLQEFTTGKRIMFFITDGGASCTSQDTPQRPYYNDGNGCHDWEDPDNIVTLLGNAYTDTAAPINTLVVGVAGSDTTAKSGINYPPYSVQLALSAYALAGSPDTVPAGCDGTYTQSGAPPTTPCHFDLSSTPTFASALSTDIEKVRNQLLGCTFALPIPKSGGTVDPDEVNVEYSTGSGAPVAIDKRASSSDACSSSPGCWDYNSMGQVELIGAACTAVQTASSADVKILVGCKTVIK
jgi:hypothetical protein